MAAVTITLTIPVEQKQYIKDHFLSPSKILQKAMREIMDQKAESPASH
ncbi:MAG: hypothetical protein RBG13Loki_1466 [Promethearchaeota archaeon CR_4]|nr:MAG: hypothetical protein RBG13Loki_1466 [Candidatus Lokiarchaeota archaeon CR_4]